jgi:hypothetical protein
MLEKLEEVPPSERWLTVALVCIVPRPFLFMGIEILTRD